MANAHDHVILGVGEDQTPFRRGCQDRLAVLVYCNFGTAYLQAHVCNYYNAGSSPAMAEGVKVMADRRAGRVPHVRLRGGDIVPRSRNLNGRWRKKRSDAGHERNNGASATLRRSAA